MTPQDREHIRALRLQGRDYSSIAYETKLTLATVKSYCRRNALLDKDLAQHMKEQENRCRNCGITITQTPKHRKRHFCSDACRYRWWNTHPGSRKSKGVLKRMCPVCGTAFDSYKRAATFCSRACYFTARFGKGDKPHEADDI